MHGHGQSATPNRRMNIGQYLWRMYEYGKRLEIMSPPPHSIQWSEHQPSHISVMEKNKIKGKRNSSLRMSSLCVAMCLSNAKWSVGMCGCVCVRIGREVFLLFLFDSNFFLFSSFACLFAYQQNKIREIERVKKMLNEDGVSAERG